MIVDTTFLIDLEREVSRRRPGPATEYLARHPDATLSVSVITVGELSEGYDRGDAPELRKLLEPYEVLDVSRPVAQRYGAISRALRSSGSRWGDNDLWIAATALEAGEPLLTRDGSHFGRIEGLAVEGY